MQDTQETFAADVWRQWCKREGRLPCLPQVPAPMHRYIHLPAATAPLTGTVASPQCLYSVREAQIGVMSRTIGTRAKDLAGLTPTAGKVNLSRR